MLPTTTGPMPRDISVATYNVHRWTGISGRAAPDAARAGFVISELGADIIALQEVLRPFSGEDPLERLAEALGLHVAYGVTRVHRQGQLGNAILSRWPISSVQVLDLTFTRMERRVALAASFDALGGGEALNVVATHLALVDRTRHRQVESVLEHPLLRAGPGVLLGDMNAWRRDKASRALARNMDEHHNRDWPASYPAMRPVLALDRVYARGAQVMSMAAHDSTAARRASDHLPIVARLRLHRHDEGDDG
jgi:endonuclease/exonuclease/phosphatase family metal-dependent hydrolase